MPKKPKPSVDTLNRQRVNVEGQSTSTAASGLQTAAALAYSAGDLVRHFNPVGAPIVDVVSEEGNGGFIVGAKLYHDEPGTTPRFRIHIFNQDIWQAPFSGLGNDGDAFVLSAAVWRFHYQGYIDVPAGKAGTDLVHSINMDARMPFVTKDPDPVGGGTASRNLWFAIEVLDAWTTTNSRTIIIELFVERG